MSMSRFIAEIAEFTGSITKSAKDQSVGADEISSSLLSIDRATQQNAAMNEEVLAVVNILTEMAGKMMNVVKGFTLDQVRARSLDHPTSSAPAAQSKNTAA